MQQKDYLTSNSLQMCHFSARCHLHLKPPQDEIMNRIVISQRGKTDSSQVFSIPQMLTWKNSWKLTSTSWLCIIEPPMTFPSHGRGCQNNYAIPSSNAWPRQCPLINRQLAICVSGRSNTCQKSISLLQPTGGIQAIKMCSLVLRVHVVTLEARWSALVTAKRASQDSQMESAWTSTDHCCELLNWLYSSACELYIAI